MTSSPVGAPDIWIIVLSPVVVPCTIDVVAASSAAASANPAASARRAMPASTPSDWSSGVVGVFSSTNVPSGDSSTQSVNVPPTSSPILMLIRSLVREGGLRPEGLLRSLASSTLASLTPSPRRGESV